MDDYGSITIDNKNLLDDLLGLNGDDDPFSLESKNLGYLKPAPTKYDKKPSSSYLGQQSQTAARKIFLESPTFAKGEDDIYRYVHSRISSVDPMSTRNHHLSDSLDLVTNDKPNDSIALNKPYEKSQPLTFNRSQSQAPTDSRISANRLLSDLAVASLPRPDQPSKPFRSNIGETLYENDLLDSLDATNLNSAKISKTNSQNTAANNKGFSSFSNNLINTTSSNSGANNLNANQIPQTLGNTNGFQANNILFGSTGKQASFQLQQQPPPQQLLHNRNLPDQATNQSFTFENQLKIQLQQEQLKLHQDHLKFQKEQEKEEQQQTLHHQELLEQQIIQQQQQINQLQQQQLQLQYLPQQQQQAQQIAQYQSLIPIQALPSLPLQPQLQAQPIPGLITLVPTAAPNGLPIVHSSLQFHPPAPQFIPIQIPQAQLIATQPNTATSTAQPNNTNMLQPMYYNAGNGYPINNNYYQGQASTTDGGVEDLDDSQYPQSDLVNQYHTSQRVKHQQAPTNLMVHNGSIYDAQPLQPPQPPPRLANQSRLINSNSQNSLKNGDTPERYTSRNDDNADLNNEFGALKLYDNKNHVSDDEVKRAEVWNKLQKANKDKSNSGNKRNNTSHGLPPPSKASNYSKKPPRSGQNFLEKNIEAIRNKENLLYRYPQNYETLHGKNVSGRVKSIYGSQPMKPPHHLQPIENYDDDYQDDYDQKARSVTLNMTQEEEGFGNRKITIPLDPSKFKDKDHINLDINLRLVDFLANQGNRSMENFEQNEPQDPLSRYIKRYESNISRSLPGSSGSLNKLKPLPPLNGRTHPKSVQSYGSHHQSDYDNKLQHEYDNEVKSEDGYLAQLIKSKYKKPTVKPYSLKDYKVFKKDALPTTNNTTGKLGFDYENDMYKKKVESMQKKVDYAERVKARNRIILAEQKRLEEEESVKHVSPNHQQNKFQRV